MDFGGGHQNGGSGHSRCLFPHRLRSKVHENDAHHVGINVSTLLVINRRRVAIGLENGHILIYSSTSTNPSGWELELTIGPLYVLRLPVSPQVADPDFRNAHVDQIHRVAWRPLTTKGEGEGVIKKQLASCSEDHTLRILNVLLKV
jgi:hypothetical protein